MSKLDIQVKRSDFFNLVSQAYSLIEKRNIMPILSKVLICGDKNDLSVQATDQDNSLQSYIPAQIKKTGKVVIDAQNLYEILKELPEGDIELSQQDDKKIRLKQGTSIFHLLSLEVKDFPAFPPFNMKDSFFIEAKTIKYLIEKTSFCSSLDDTSYHLTGVFFEQAKEVMKKDGKDVIRFVATDGHRLGLAENPCASDISLKDGVIISKKGVQEIKKLISYMDTEEKLEITIKPPRILFQHGKTTLSVKLVEGSYPNYQPLIPKESNVQVVLSTEEFGHSLRKVSLLSSSKYKGVNFYIKKNKIQMEAENPDLGSAQDEVKSERKKGEDLAVRFNARYVLEALRSIDSEKTLLEFCGKEKPCLIRPYLENENKSEQGLCVVMPMKM